MHNIPALAGIDTRALTNRIREQGMPHGVIVQSANGEIDVPAAVKPARAFPGLVGLDLAKDVTTPPDLQVARDALGVEQGLWRTAGTELARVVIDYGVKRNILRMLAGLGAEITVVPAQATFDDVMRHKPHGVLLSNGPGDPAATGVYAIPTIKGIARNQHSVVRHLPRPSDAGPGAGGETRKMAQGHHGANHPVKDLETGKVEIVSMNHGFTVDGETLPKGVKQTHVSLFDGTNCGIARRRQARVQRAVSPRSLARPDGFALSVRALRAGGEDRTLDMAKLPLKIDLIASARKLAASSQSSISLFQHGDANLLLFVPSDQDMQVKHERDDPDPFQRI